ncbi:MAG TPA: 4-hydroxybutyrate dehydrogenase [Clostridiales bacterium]|nr:4-hydroxybutyrate dehydrogenase [Clostridiales bacterium]
MRELYIKPAIHEFDDFKSFAQEFALSEKDLILTNEYIYNPIIAEVNPPCRKLFQEKYGAGEPDDKMAQALMDEVRAMDCDRIIAVGGGTVIDLAKILVLSGSDDIYDLLDNADKMTKGKQLVVIPTTCGTGSEATNISILNLSRYGTKKGLVLDTICADSAVLIPEFLKSLPYYVFAMSSIDALIHATEGYLSPRASYLSDMFAERAIRDIIKGYKDIAEKGQDTRFENGKLFLHASTCGGVAISNPGGGIVHGMSYALGGKYHVAHGESNYVFFTNILRMYREKAPDGKMKQLEKLIAEAFPGQDALDALDGLLNAVYPKKGMRDFGATREDIAAFAKSTMDNQQRLLKGSYTTLTEEDILLLFEQSY